MPGPPYATAYGQCTSKIFDVQAQGRVLYQRSQQRHHAARTNVRRLAFCKVKEENDRAIQPWLRFHGGGPAGEAKIPQDSAVVPKHLGRQAAAQLWPWELKLTDNFRPELRWQTVPRHGDVGDD